MFMDSHACGPATAACFPRGGPGTAGGARRPSVAVIGAGVSGLTAAYLLSRTHDVILFEAADRLGGHAHTHDVLGPDGRRHAVDSGFIVHNDRTYPWLRKLFGELGIQVRRTEMSMSVRCEECGLEYAGGRGLRGVLAQPRRLADPQFIRMLGQVRRFHRRGGGGLRGAAGGRGRGGVLAQPRRLADPQFIRMLGQVRRFHRRAAAFLRAAAADDLSTYGEFLRREGFSDHFVAHYAVPVVSCVWSAGSETALRYPARYLFTFLDQHGMLRVTGSPRWYTVTGGSRTYVDPPGPPPAGRPAGPPAP